jgi:hypothetical protein
MDRVVRGLIVLKLFFNFYILNFYQLSIDNGQ